MHCVSEKLVVHNSGKMLDFQDAVTVVFSNKICIKPHANISHYTLIV